MTATLPDYLRIPSAELGNRHSVYVKICGDNVALASEMAGEILREIREAADAGRAATLIVPVGPVDQFPILARMINSQRVNCRNAAFINMDEYLTDTDEWIPHEHPLSFRGFMDRCFYNLIDPNLAPNAEHRVFPDPVRPEAISELVETRGGADACFGGIGINGHIAFNEPPEPSETINTDEFAKRPTRVLSLTRETRTINSVTVGGEISIIPKRAVTVGMREILASRKLRFYCNRPWQSSVVRRVLHGPITPSCPASLLRLHSDAMITVTELVAALPKMRLR